MKKKHGKLLVAFFVSYAVVLIIPLMIGGIAYIRAGQMIKEEVDRSNTAILSRISDMMDARVREMEQLAMQVSMNPTIQHFLYVKQPLTEKELYEVTLVMKNIGAHKNANSFIDELFIYFRGCESVFSSNSRYPVEYFYENVYSYKDVSYTYWHDEILPKYYYHYYIPATDMIADGSRDKRMLTFMSSMPFGQKFNPLATIIMLIDEQKIKNMLQGIEPKGTVYIVDKDNRVIVTTDESDQQYMPNYNTLIGNNGFTTLTINGEDAAISYITSSYTGWKYVSVVPTSVFMVKVNRIKDMTLWVLGVCLGIGLIIAYVFARKNYGPIAHIVEMLSAFTGKTPADGNLDEMGFIKEAVTVTIDKNNELEDRYKQIIEQNRKYQEQLSVNGPLIKNGLLSKLMKNRIDDYEAIINPLKSYGVNFPYDRYAVMLFHIDDCSGFILDDNDREWGLVRFIITNAVEELANEHNKGYMVEVEYDTLALIMNFSSDIRQQNINDRMLYIAKKLNYFMKNEFGTDLTVAIGGVHIGMGGIRISYEEAVKALEYRIVKGNGTIIAYDDITNRDKNYYYPVDMELQLINCVKVGDREKAERILDHIIDESFYKRNLSVEMIRCLFFDVMSTAIKTLDEINVDYKDVFKGDDVVDRLLKCDTVQKMHEEVKRMYGDICRYIENHKKSHNTELKEKILQYIDQHYMDEGINQAAIAEHFGITAPYLSRFFKQETGQNMVDYINGVRMAKAKLFLQDFSLSLYDVAKNVGLSSDIALIRIFKKYEGITPGKYREILQTQGKIDQ